MLLDQFADWEGALLAPALNMGVDIMPQPEAQKYVARTLAPSKAGVCSIGGMRVIPDYDFEEMPEDFAALVLVGGLGWRSEEAQTLAPCVRKAVAAGKVVGAICNASLYLGALGLLNGVKHTSNTLALLEAWAGKAYTNAPGYVEQQAVSDGGIVTANGTAALEFTREMLLALGADTSERIEAWYAFNKQGFCPAKQRHGS